MNTAPLHSNLKPVRVLWMLLLISAAFTSKASHYAGSDITYQCTGSAGVYNINVKIYKDCGGIALCNCPGLASCALSINITGAAGSCSGTSFGSQNLAVVPAISGLDVVQLCASSSSICSNCGTRTPGSFTPGIEVYTFNGDVNLNSLPASCCMVSIGFGDCCRNSSITTLVNPSGTSFYSEAIINRCATPCNSSPTFTNAPIIAICAGQDFTYNLGAIDPDGDSLSYAFGSSLTASGTAAGYVSPYSPTVPFPYLGAPIQSPPATPPVGINIDPNSGDIRFRPIGYFVANLVIEIKQWKSVAGVPTLMGVCRRDIQLYSQACVTNNPPTFKTYDATGTLTSPQPNYAYSVCAGQQLCFYIVGADGTASFDTTDLTWANPYNIVNNGGTFVKAYNVATRNTNGPRYDSARFCWTPPASMGQNLPYYFAVNARDRACPITGTASHSFSVLVRKIPLASITKTNQGCGYYNFGYSLSNGVPLSTAYTQFEVETAPGSNTFVSYMGNSVSNHYFSHAGYHKLRLHLTTVGPPTPNGCPNDNILDSILVAPLVHVSIADTTNGCQGIASNIMAHTSGGKKFSNGYRYTFYSGGISSTAVIRAASPDSVLGITSFVAGSGTYKVITRDSSGCSDSAVFTLITSPAPARQLSGNIRHCFGVYDTLNAGNNNGIITSWKWFKSPALPALLNDSSQKIAVTDSGRYVVHKINPSGCGSFDTVMVYTNNKVVVSAGPDRNFCFNSPAINITASSNNAAADSFQWRQLPVADPVLVYSHSPTITLAPLLYSSFQVRGFITYGGVTCSGADSVNVAVKDLPAVNTPAPVPVCITAATINLPALTAANKPGSLTTQWSYTANPAALSGNVLTVAGLQNKPTLPTQNPGGNFITFSATDADGCHATDSLVVAVFPTPVINAGPRRTFCDNAAPFDIKPGTQLYSPNGGALGTNETWMGNGIYKPNAGQNLFAFNPHATGVKADSNIITYRFPVTYPASNLVAFNPPVSGYSSAGPAGGCMASDTVIFDVIKTPVLHAGLANPTCKASDSINLDQYLLNRSTTATNPLTSYWYFGGADHIYNASITNGRIFFALHPVIPDSTKQYMLVYADSSTTCRVSDTSLLQINKSPATSMAFATAADSVTDVTRDSIQFILSPAVSMATPGSNLTSVPALPSTAFDVTTGRFYLNGVLPGVYKIVFYFTDPVTFCSNAAALTVRITSASGLPSYNSARVAQGLNIFPNPNNGSFVLTMQAPASGRYAIEIYNANGAKVHNTDRELSQGNNELDMKLNFAAGIYFVKVTNGTARFVKRFVIE